jgi:hypothetical protein
MAARRERAAAVDAGDRVMGDVSRMSAFEGLTDIPPAGRRCSFLTRLRHQRKILISEI